MQQGENTFLYVFGGRQPEQLGEVYDGTEVISSLNDMHRICIAGKDSNQGWEELSCTGDVPSVRSYTALVSAAPLNKGKGDLYLFGGMVNDDRYSDLYHFNTMENEWTRLQDGPMTGRGGAGIFAGAIHTPIDPSVNPRGSVGPVMSNGICIVGGFCGTPVSDVWVYECGHSGEGSAWSERDALELPSPRSIYAGPIATPGGSFMMFGGELAAADANETAGIYSSETLRLTGLETTIEPTTGAVPAARGWTSGCVVDRQGQPCFAVFGGIREGQPGSGEPAGVRLGDLCLLAIG